MTSLELLKIHLQNRCSQISKSTRSKKEKYLVQHEIERILYIVHQLEPNKEERVQEASDETVEV
jgi:hypothetical protein